MIVKKLFIILFLLLEIFYSSCKHKSEICKDIPNKVVLIFQNIPKDINIKKSPDRKGGVANKYDISYMDSTETKTRIALQKTPHLDTIIIYTNNEVLELTHNFNAIESSTYLFNKGDSVLFTYKDNIPYANVLNRKITFPESNYDIYMREKVRNNKLPAIEYYNNSNAAIFMTKFNTEKSIEKKRNVDDVIEEWIREYKIMDSLYNLNLLSTQVLNYRRNILIEKINSTCEQDSIFLQNPETKKVLANTVAFAVNNDSLLQFNYYQNYIRRKINQFTETIKPIMIGNGGSGGRYPNYFARFDTINKLNFLSVKSKQYLLKNELESIFENGDRTKIEKYCDKYISITGDSLYVSRLLAENKMNLSMNNDLLLMDRNNNQTNLYEVLEKNKGKVIYLDFWASWCAPCKQSMPDAKKLREEYKNKDVVFIYLAYKDEQEAWNVDEQKLEVNYLSKSYFITNSKTAKIIEDLDVRFIPRYLLINKKGVLTFRNAPGPHGKEIRDYLNKLLKE